MENQIKRLQEIAGSRVAADDCQALANEMLGMSQDSKGRIERVISKQIDEGLLDGLSYIDILSSIKEGLFELFQRRLV
ncbi:hypothetical protein [Piscirickettsia litoralis]|uniref:Uncharacterized protein n=1 Tax=Piscirickettsia litoralis TaxID=1891921 RepID=A0ABX3A0Y1_9GAMM|nr:hypothetical protein [Piscirickettsia litoralis]ODN41288.1 hypothetical protein BGC07_17140 [Piscirickettsia litoralis]